MADVTNPEAIRFVNEQIRPIAERLRDLKALADYLAGLWNAGFNVTIGDSADDDILDDRESQGVSRLTAADVTNLVTQVNTILAQFAGTGVMDVIRKPCVRALRVIGD